MNRLTTIIIFLLLSLLTGIFLIWPKYQAFKEERVLLLQKEAELKSQKQHESKIYSLSEELKKYSAELEKIDSALAPKFSLLSFLDYLQKTASESGLIFKKYSPPSVSQKDQGGQGQIKEYGFGLTVSGSYSSFIKFLSALETNVKLIEIEQLAFPSPIGENSLDFNVGIKVYSY